jgi:addiction module HigA family antidote
MSKSSIITDTDWLPNPHAGELLYSEFMEPLDIDVMALAQAISVEPLRLDALILGSARIDGELDLRLARYFRMSEGFFLRLQDQYDLRRAKHALNGDLEKITPHAA